MNHNAHVIACINPDTLKVITVSIHTEGATVLRHASYHGNSIIVDVCHEWANTYAQAVELAEEHLRTIAPLWALYQGAC